MLDHHIQKSIVYQLALVDAARFGELKPPDIENKLFDYHLKKTLALGLVEKRSDGRYRLTPRGRRIGKNAHQRAEYMTDRAYALLLLVIRRASDGAWLLVRRKAQPLLGRIGFMHAVPSSDRSVTAAAADELAARTGLTATLTVRGSGYARMFDGGVIDSFITFTVIEGTDATGELAGDAADELAEYFWSEALPLDDPALLPTARDIAAAMATPGLFYLDKDYHKTDSSA